MTLSYKKCKEAKPDKVRLFTRFRVFFILLAAGKLEGFREFSWGDYGVSGPFEDSFSLR
jgi:hypothetical protein